MSLYKPKSFLHIFSKQHILRQLNYVNYRKFCKDEKPTDTPLKNLLENAASFEDAKPQVPEDEWATLPYPEGAKINRDQSAKALRPSLDPRETSIICFPGQGNQFVGMGKNLYKYPLVKDMFEMANDILK